MPSNINFIVYYAESVDCSAAKRCGPQNTGRGSSVASEAAWDVSGAEINPTPGTFFLEDLVIISEILLRCQSSSSVDSRKVVAS